MTTTRSRAGAARAGAGFPSVAQLLHGAMREAVAAAGAQARSGSWFGNAHWDPAGFYFVDNHQGECGAIWFSSESIAAGILSSGDPWRKYDYRRAIARAPSEARSALLWLVQEYPFRFGEAASPRINAVFWSDDGRLAAPEPWSSFAEYGGRVLEAELKDDATWATDGWGPADEDGAPDPATARVMIALAKRRLAAGAAVTLTAREERTIVPVDALGRAEALDTLRCGGRWAIVAGPLRAAHRAG